MNAQSSNQNSPVLADARATYSPEDNKLRLYPVSRLPADIYERVKEAGFKWAPKQGLFVAPVWTPSREDLLLELCGEVEDEDTSLAERAEERADRFAGYRANRTAEADQARRNVSAIADGIPFGQPILVGHHSEARARRDAEKIESGMRKAVRLWETADYWRSRAAGAIAAAKYKERPDVRARRIRTIEADARKEQRAKSAAEQGLCFWRGEMKLRNTKTGEVRTISIAEENRATIREILGGIMGNTVGNFFVVRHADRFGGWSAGDVLKPDGERYQACPACSVEQCREAAERSFTEQIAWCDRWLSHYANRLSYERAMLAADGGTVAERTGPEKGGAVKCWATSRGAWSYIVKVNRVSVTILDNWGNGGANFTRTIPFDKLAAVMPAAEVEAARSEGRLHELADKTGFMLSAPKAATESEPAAAAPSAPATPAPAENAAPESAEAFRAMRATLRAGVHVVSAPQLFPTPRHIAQRMVELANISTGQRVLEPSAGTGTLLEAIRAAGVAAVTTAVEIEFNLAHRLRAKFDDVRQADFLTCNGDLGKFDRVLMNPPFANGVDVAHIKHALTFLRPGGRLVALCANGPRQVRELQPLATSWEDLPAGSFAEQGTNVNVALITFER